MAVSRPAPPTPPAHTGRLELAAGLATIVAGIALIAIVPELRHCVNLVIHGRFAALRSYVRSLGAGGVALLLGLMLAHAIIFYPSEIITTTAGYVYGFGPGLAFVVVGWLLAALLSYALGRSVGRPLLQRVLGHRFGWLTATMEGGGTTLLLSSRLIPIVPFALIGYAAGATHTNLWRFSWTTVLGYLPLTIAVVYLGSRAQTLSTGDPLVWIAVAVLIGLLIGEQLVRRRVIGSRRPRRRG
ncbi:MAG TPA: VTT domain-containing protein [Solirubrobacteraceae bacterium]|nr:VTT domain-containing protein [Solirubrobacteraceae bacterium]